MQFKDITTWTVTPDNMVRPKNPYEVIKCNVLCIAIDDIDKSDDFEAFAKQHVYHCSPSLVAGEYPAEMFELVWQIQMDKKLNGGWETIPTKDLSGYVFNGSKWVVRQYLQLKQPVQSKEWSSESIEADIYSAIAHGLSDVETDKNISPDIAISVENVIDVLKLRKLI